MSVYDVSGIHRLARCETTIQVLEDMLELARKGECVSVLMVWQDNLDKFHHVRSLMVRDIPQFIGVLEMFKTNLVTRALTGEPMMNESDGII